MNTTQEDQILEALKINPGGLHPTYFIRDLFIYQYNARINGLRKRFGCECKNGNRCCASEHIINKRGPNKTTLFVYQKTGGPDWEKMRLDAIKSREEPEKKEDLQIGLL